MSAATSQRMTTRSSLRQTLGLTSMGKVLSDAIHKEDKPRRTREKDAAPVAKEKETGSARRVQQTHTTAGRTSASVSRASMNERPAAATSTLSPKEDEPRRSATVTTKRVVTRSQKIALNSSTEGGSSTSVSAATTASPVVEKPRSGLRPRTANTGSAVASSGLPKYRPRSVVIDPTNKASPARPSVRRRLSDSEDSLLDSDSDSSLFEGASSRPISPMPKRAAVKVHLSATTKDSPLLATPPTSFRAKDTSRPPRSNSPVRPPTKLSKKGPPPTSNHVVSGTSIQRPSSAASLAGTGHTRAGSSSATPRSVRSVFGFGKPSPASSSSVKLPDTTRGSASASASKRNMSPQRPAPSTSTPSPKRAPRSAKPVTSTPISDAGSTPTASPFRADDSFNVDMMLTMASPSAPTPAGPPRIVFPSGSASPETPTRKNMAKAARSFLLTPEGPGSHLRPDIRPQMRDRGSMTLEQLAATSVQALDPEDNHVLSEILAPFVSRSNSIATPLSPSFAPLGLSEIPESPAFQGFAMLSPGQSLSQILLPQMTPSPAPRRELYDDNSMAHMADMPPPPGPDTVMLRLQVAAAENVARERLMTVQSLERDLHLANEARIRETQELSMRLEHVEEEMRSNMSIREEANDEHTARISALERELSQARASRQKDVKVATAAAKQELQVAASKSLQRERGRLQTANSADAAAARWAMVMDVAEAELELIESNKETLAVLRDLLAGTLAQMNAR